MTDLVTDPEHCCDVLSCFKPIIAEIVGRACPIIIENDVKLVQGSYAISKLLMDCPFLIDLTEKLFIQLKIASQQEEMTDNDTKILLKTYKNLALADAGKFFTCINWALVVRGLISGDHNALRCLCVIAKVADLSRILPKDVLSQFQNDWFSNYLLKTGSITNMDDDTLSETQQEFETVPFDGNDIRTNLVPIAGILLSTAKMVLKEYSEHCTFIVTQSLSAAVKALTLSLATRTPAIIEGKLGVGKTSLLEHFATLMGRNNSSEILKLQLGDQTDSKVLLKSFFQRSMYICCNRVDCSSIQL